MKGFAVLLADFSKGKPRSVVAMLDCRDITLKDVKIDLGGNLGICRRSALVGFEQRQLQLLNTTVGRRFMTRN